MAPAPELTKKEKANNTLIIVSYKNPYLPPDQLHLSDVSICYTDNIIVVLSKHHDLKIYSRAEVGNFYVEMLER